MNPMSRRGLLAATAAGSLASAAAKAQAPTFGNPDLPPQEVWEGLSRCELPKLWIPKREDLHIVDAIPTLGTGKVDLRAVRQVAAERSA